MIPIYTLKLYILSYNYISITELLSTATIKKKMNIQKIKLLLKNTLNLKKVSVSGDQNHLKIIAIGQIFYGISQVNRQKMVYTPLTEMISQKHIHAISIESYTLDEWNKKI